MLGVRKKSRNYWSLLHIRIKEYMLKEIKVEYFNFILGSNFGILTTFRAEFEFKSNFEG